MTNQSSDIIMISFFQIFLLALAQGGGAAIIYLPGIAEAGRDLWVSLFLASSFGYIVVYAHYLPLSMCPGCSLPQAINKYWGKIIGTFVNLYYLLFFYFLCILIVADVFFFGKVTMPETPPFIFIIFFLVPALYAAKLGLETLARFTEFILPFIVLTYILMKLLILPKMEFINLLPIMEYGMGPVLEGAIPNLNFPYAQLLPVVFFYKYVVTEKENKKRFLYFFFAAIFLNSLLLLIRTITSISAFEINVLKNMTYPPYSTIRLIEVGEVIERVDSMLFGTFYATTFLKFSITFFVICQIISDHFEAGAPKDFATPMLVLIGVSMPFLIPRFDIILGSVVPYLYVFSPIFFTIPILLFITIKVKNRKKHGQKAKKKKEQS